MKLKGVYLVDVILLLGYGPFTWFEVGLEMVIFFVSFVGICKCKWWGKNGAVVLVCGGGRRRRQRRGCCPIPIRCGGGRAGGLLPDPISW